jgi:hypothetical protein
MGQGGRMCLLRIWGCQLGALMSGGGRPHPLEQLIDDQQVWWPKCPCPGQDGRLQGVGCGWGWSARTHGVDGTMGNRR